MTRYAEAAARVARFRAGAAAASHAGRDSEEVRADAGAVGVESDGWPGDGAVVRFAALSRLCWRRG